MSGALARREKEEGAEDVLNVDFLADLRFEMVAQVKHRYSGTVIDVKCTVALGGSDSTRILEITVTPVAAPSGVLGKFPVLPHRPAYSVSPLHHCLFSHMR